MKMFRLLSVTLIATLCLSACHSSKKLSKNSEPYHTLKTDLTTAQVSRMGDTIKVVYPEIAMFDFGKDEIKSEAKSSMTRFAAILQNYPAIRIIINGYTDNVGTDDVNNALSARRAASARSLMTAQGIGDSRIATAGMGPRNPVMSNETDAGRAANRRVEFLLYAAK